jgi:hypothetical protein
MQMNSLDNLRFRIQIGELELYDLNYFSKFYIATVRNTHTNRISQYEIYESSGISSINKLFFNL